ncbi:DUF4350 domain-containing protein [Agromyces sp. LHK192]|uniref:DUF4350 domain-containing protein n=1 Tax=Agromyces sp. LHK192 TaxID=2498704 RepID=UPI000FDC6750|nr:DUF4350 domain-containing protein [Agromyces sp. LHK192]
MTAPAGANPSAAPVASAPAAARTPTLRERLRRQRTWLVLGVVLLLGGALTIAIRGFGSAGAIPLGASDASPAGSKALVQVLRGQGVEVVEARTIDQAVSEAGSDATVFLHDADGLLGSDDLERLAGSAERLVVAAPDFTTLETLAPGVRHAGVPGGRLDAASCDFGPAERAEALSDGQRLLAVDDDAVDDGREGCFPDGDDGFALVTGPGPEGGELVLVGATTVFENAAIDEAGNAALALGATGASPRLVWYLPGPTDAAGGGAPTLGELIPGWVSPVLVLAVILTVVAGVVAGRRFGRLVVEDLPVHVPAGETAAGRARLYAASASRGHALDQLRIAAIRRLAKTLRLPAAASVDDVAFAAASAVHADPARIRSLLADEHPAGDARFTELARELDALEHDVRAAIRPDHDPAAGRRDAPGPAVPRPDQTGRRP